MTVVASSKITLSDVRVRILRLPREVRAALPEAAATMTVILEGHPDVEVLNIASHRGYLGGVTNLFRRANILRTRDDVVEGRASEVDWNYSPADGIARISIAPVEDWQAVPQPAENGEPVLRGESVAELEEAEEVLSQGSAAHRPFFVPIARAIAELGGSARKRDVVRKMRVILADELNEKQLDYLEANNRYGWARKQLKDAGLIGGEYGVWALTELGKIYEETHRGDALEIPASIRESDTPARSTVKTETVEVTGFRGYEIPMLRALEAGETDKAELFDRLEAIMGKALLAGDRRIMPGNNPVWRFRASWALSNLGKAGFAENTGRGEWALTDAGRERLKNEGERWDARTFHGSKAKVRVEHEGAAGEPVGPAWDLADWNAARRELGKNLHGQLTMRLRPELGPTPDDPLPRNIILYGPPGTGKTHLAKVVARALTGEDGASEDGPFRLVQFHPSYAYEDFVQGLRPDLNKTELQYKIHEGPFRKIAEAAAQDPDAFYVLVIDEINRGDPARIFGELLYSLEYRDEAVTLPAGGTLTVPSNLVIIGTMNSVDRSVALVDYALRRRFGFLRVDPDPAVIQTVRGSGTLAETGPAVLEKFNAWIRKRLGREHQLGHSYFLSSALPEDADDVFDRIWTMDAAPLLEEYFFGDDAALAEAERVWRRAVSEEAAARAQVEQESQEEDEAS